MRFSLGPSASLIMLFMLGPSLLPGLGLKPAFSGVAGPVAPHAIERKLTINMGHDAAGVKVVDSPRSFTCRGR